jgi:hypothetical protein
VNLQPDLDLGLAALDRVRGGRVEQRFGMDVVVLRAAAAPRPGQEEGGEG